METASLKKGAGKRGEEHGLTSFNIRDDFIKAGNAKLQKAAQFGQPVTLIYVDLDDFGKYKLEHGEAQAKLVLARLEQCFRENLRTGDLIAHIHGDEFLILLPGVYPENGMGALHRFQAVLDDVLRQSRWPITASIGAVTYLSCPSSVESMIETVEPIMHAVKKSGKNATKHKIFT